MVEFSKARTVAWEDGVVVLIDQTKLPEEFSYLKCRDERQVADAIRNLVVRGAPAIGVAAAMGLALAAYNSRAGDTASLLKELEAASNMLRETRPTAVNLRWGLERILNVARIAKGGVGEVRSAVVNEAKRMANEDVEVNKAMGRHGASLLDDGDTVLTHCNTGTLATVSYGTALGVMRAAREEGKCIKVVATETRPVLQGGRLTTFELKEDGFPATLISDTAVGYAMSVGLVNKVVLGADRILRSGHVFNKIGTYQIAVLAERHMIPFYVVAPSSTFDLVNSVNDVRIEDRKFEEVAFIGGKRIAPAGISIMNPAFDVTPPELVTALVTEKGIIRPPYDENIRKLIAV